MRTVLRISRWTQSKWFWFCLTSRASESGASLTHTFLSPSGLTLTSSVSQNFFTASLLWCLLALPSHRAHLTCRLSLQGWLSGQGTRADSTLVSLVAPGNALEKVFEPLQEPRGLGLGGGWLRDLLSCLVVDAAQHSLSSLFSEPLLGLWPWEGRSPSSLSARSFKS